MFFFSRKFLKLLPMFSWKTMREKNSNGKSSDGEITIVLFNSSF